jgi:HTTM domain
MKQMCLPFQTWRRDLAAGWNRFWFAPQDPTTVAAIRIGVGLVLLYIHLASTPALLDQIGPKAWIDAKAIEQVKGMSSPADWQRHLADHWWGQSVWFYVQDPAAIYAVHALFLAAILCFTLGQFSRTATVVVWLFHLSYIHRSLLAWHGMDSVLVMLLFCLMFAPTGAALSLDRYWRQRRATREAKYGRARDLSVPEPSWTANLAIRMIQIHMCVIYLCAGLAKIKGARWWDGTAVWTTMTLQEFAPFDVSWLAHGGDTLCLVVSTAGVVLTLFVEISFAFLIWNARWRPVLLLLAVLMHVGIGVFMGLGTFQAVMLLGDLSFIAPESVRGMLDKWTGKSSPAIVRSTSQT